MSVPGLVAAYDGLGQTLFTRLARQPGNVVLSPLSIGTALAMTLAGARGPTEAEMRRILGHDLPRDEIAAASAALIGALEGYGRQDATHIAIANALLLDETRGGAILPSYRKLARDSFAAEIMAGATAEEVNAWAARETMGLVPRLLETVGEAIVAMILNAVVFSANWAAPFDPEKTRPGSFALPSGEQVQVPMMRGRVYARVASSPDYRAVRIPFSLSHLGLVIVLPARAAALDHLGEALDGLAQKRLLGSMGDATLVALTLPKFRVATNADLVPLLQDAGLSLAFEDEADFGAMAEMEPGVKIGQIRHGACIEVHEAGCAAAAATVVEMVGRASIGPDPVPFDVDRPFLYFLVDDSTGATLMRGRVADPRG